MYRMMYLPRALDDREIRAEAAEQDLLPDERRRPRGRARRGRPRTSRRRLVLSLLPRPRALPGARHDAVDQLLEAVGARRRVRLGRPPDALALGQPRSATSRRRRADRHAVPAGRRVRRGGRRARAPSKARRSRAAASRTTRSSTCRSGEGTTSEGEFWEALNTACTRKLPVAVPDRGQRLRDLACRSRCRRRGRQHLAARVGLPGPARERVRRLRSGRVVYDAAARSRRAGAGQRKGPALVHAHVTRPYSHSLSDDEALYRPRGARASRRARRDPLRTFRSAAPRPRAWRPRPSSRRCEAVDGSRGRPRDRRARSAAPQPDPDDAMQLVYSETVDPTAAGVRHRGRAPVRRRRPTMVDLINACLHDEMARDPRIVVFGEDVADASREERAARGARARAASSR